MSAKKILIATSNRFKIDEMRWFLKDLQDFDVFNLQDVLEQAPDIEEDGETLKENSDKKAGEISKLTDLLVFTSDAGVDIPSLGDKWDYRRPKRILGEHATDTERMSNLMNIMKDITDRKAIYILAISIAHKGDVIWSKEFVSYPGEIVTEPNYENVGLNRAMGRVWFLPDFCQTEDELTEDQRNMLRHKYQSEIKKELEEFLLQLN